MSSMIESSATSCTSPNVPEEYPTFIVKAKVFRGSFSRFRLLIFDALFWYPELGIFKPAKRDSRDSAEV